MQSLPKHLYHLYSCLFMIAIFNYSIKYIFLQDSKHHQTKAINSTHISISELIKKKKLAQCNGQEEGRKEGVATDHWCGSQNESYLILLVKAYKNSCVLYKICPSPPKIPVVLHHEVIAFSKKGSCYKRKIAVGVAHL